MNETEKKKKQDKNYSFVAYIDESGCDNFDKQHDGENTSKWFILSALIVRKTNDYELPKQRNAILKAISNQRNIIHMRKIKKHEHKLYIAQEVGKLPIRLINILSNKYSVLHSKRKDLFDSTNTYYSYMARYLIERISWCCSHLRRKVPEGNGKVKIVFSKRGGMQYDEFREYLQKLRDENITDAINWDIVDIDLIEAQSHSERAGLQLVDVAAFSFFKSVEPDKLGLIDISYAEKLKNVLYKHNGKLEGYGIKIVPNPETLPTNEKPTSLLNILKL